MIVNEKIISIPHFISTSWSNVAALHMKGSLLLITLVDGDTIAVPNLNDEVIEKIFHFHAQHLEEDPVNKKTKESQGKKGIIEQILDAPFRIAVGTMDGFSSSIMHHTPQQSDLPDFPLEFVEKICEIILSIAGEEALRQMQAEPHCNCPHCQVARALDERSSTTSEEFEEMMEDEEVSDEELTFNEWDIEAISDNLYSVTHRLDKETFNVYLGNPIGCTCGQEKCPHIEAVLKSPI